MPITIKQNVFKYKNPTTGQYQSIDAVADTTTSEQIAAIQAAGAEVLNDIPASYTDLSSNLITMQDTQPTNTYNKMWIKNGTSYQIPTTEDVNHAIFAVTGTLKSNITSSGNIFTQSANDSRITSSTNVANIKMDDERKVSSTAMTVTPGTGTVTITGTTVSFTGTINVVVELYN